MIKLRGVSFFFFSISNLGVWTGMDGGSLHFNVKEEVFDFCPSLYPSLLFNLNPLNSIPTALQSLQIH
ncbi:hypothetical protein SLEP1_g2317 [Rubroshorea leprosula]|uniref:Uncharacterized protein n=1 Tax=Rubroshorea leprosula TaxID=152421 RepID=A0AAV5HNA5_9ROSI|nr:hypothetical protein SLEP1_g2317 [Rubroshorea leprosula]